MRPRLQLPKVELVPNWTVVLGIPPEFTKEAALFLFGFLQNLRSP